MRVNTTRSTFALPDEGCRCTRPRHRSHKVRVPHTAPRCAQVLRSQLLPRAEPATPSLSSLRPLLGRTHRRPAATATTHSARPRGLQTAGLRRHCAPQTPP
eukprot:scaffold59431_cov67-Phaeocystis_antarctica.AAC.2